MSLLKNVLKIPTKAQIGFLKLDASLKENHVRKATVSDNELEDGTIASDHVRLTPLSLTMDAVVSDTPISILGLGVSTDDFLGAANDFFGGEKSAFEDLVKNDTRTPAEAWAYLNDTMELRTPFSVVTALDRYENMIITSLSAPRTAQNGKDLAFSIELREIITIKSSTTTIPGFKLGDGADSASSKGKLGKQSAKEANANQADNSSALLKVFKKAGVL